MVEAVGVEPTRSETSGLQPGEPANAQYFQKWWRVEESNLMPRRSRVTAD